MANGAQTIIIGVIGVAVLLIVILIPISFSYVEYYEVSFRLYSANFMKAGSSICTQTHLIITRILTSRSTSNHTDCYESPLDSQMPYISSKTYKRSTEMGKIHVLETYLRDSIFLSLFHLPR